MRARLVISAVALTVLVGTPTTWANIQIDTVTVGNPGNAADTYGDGCGAVDYTYNIGTYEVTAGQYTVFLNSVAATDTYGLYNPYMWYEPSDDYGCKIQRTGSPGSYTYSVGSDWADRPVNYVSWGDAARFSNWLHNGQPTGAQGLGTTEDGAYFLNGAVTDTELMAVTRGPDATWTIASEDEWYKAAYHQNNGPTADYFDYPTSTDSVPSNELLIPDPGNNVTYKVNGYTIGDPYYRTEVGARENSDSPYGTFDQGGNVWEWSEGIRHGAEMRGLRGGCFGSDDYNLHAACRSYYFPTYEGDSIGFRVSEVPEPGTLALLTLAGLALLRRR